jgi:hypothetical protein
VLEQIHDRTDEAVAVLYKLTIAGKVQGLEEQSKSSLDEDLIAVEAEGEAKLALVK